MEDVIKYLQSYVDEVVDNLDNSDDSSAENDSLTTLINNVSTLTTSVSTLASSVSSLAGRVSALELNPFIIQTPFLLDLTFTGISNIPATKAGFVPNGFNNNGTINVDGTLTVI